MRKVSITVAGSDENMKTVLHILETAGATFDIQHFDPHREIRTKVILKGSKKLPINFETFVSIHPCVSYFPFIETKHPEMDVAIIQNNNSADIEYRQTPSVYRSIKSLSRMNSEKVIRYAFTYAQSHNRKKVTCFAKEQSLFLNVFDDIAVDYPNLLNENWEVNLGAATLAETPELFDVIVLNEDFLSAIAAQVSGSASLTACAYVGDRGALFEARGENLSSYLLAAVQMLVYMGEAEIATSIHNAWLKSLEENKYSSENVIANLGKKPKELQPVSYQSAAEQVIPQKRSETAPKRHLVGIDVFMHHKGLLSQFLAKISHINIGPSRLKMITNLGTTVGREQKKKQRELNNGAAVF